jgi:hypothetical protein
LSIRFTAEEKDFIQANYLRLGHKEIGAAIGRNAQSVRNFCYKMGWRKAVPLWTQEELDYLRLAYKNADGPIGLVEVSERLHRDKANVCRKARELGLTNQRRKKPGNSVRLKEWRASHEHPRGHRGHHNSPEVRARIGKSLKKAWADPQSTFNSEEFRQKKSDGAVRRVLMGKFRGRQGHTRCKGGRRADLENAFFRSSWEANYARYLNWLISLGEIVGWEYEAETFEFPVKRGNRTYTPDFRVTNQDASIEYHEVKGWMDDDSRVKLDRMRRYYPDKKLIVIGEDSYRAIKRQVGGLIANWE